MISQLVEETRKTNVLICVELDPMLSYVPGHAVKKSPDAYGETLEGTTNAIWQFNRGIIDYTYGLIPAVKLQITMYGRLDIKGLIVYKKTVEYCHGEDLTVIGDARRGDIGPASAAYATGHLDTVRVGSSACRGFGMDMLTVNPYLGTDGIKPFVGVCNADDRGLFVLAKAPNPDSGEFQDRLIDGRPLYEWVAQKMMEWGAASMGGAYNNVGAAMGATYPEMSRTLRKLMPATYFLVPGYDTQGSMADGLEHCFSEDGPGAVVSSSRGIIAAYERGKHE